MKRLAQEGDIMATMKDVAEYAGVSIATVSKYLNGGNVLDKNEELIDEAIKTLDYQVNEIARGLKTNQTMTVGVLIPSLENVFFTKIVSRIENILLENGYSTIVCDYREEPDLEKKKMQFLLGKRVDGIIMVPDGKNVEHIRETLNKDIPVVLLDRMVNNIDCDIVVTDNINASYNAVEQLVKKGHKKIGIICGPEELYTSRQRLKGYQRVFEDYAMKIDKELIKFGDYQIEGGYQCLVQLLEEDISPTAVFVTNYEMTLGSIMAANDKEIDIPAELSLIGFDNIQMAKIVKPSLSIVVQPMQKIGETAARLMLKRLKGNRSNFPATFRLKAELLMKDSVRKILA